MVWHVSCLNQAKTSPDNCLMEHSRVSISSLSSLTAALTSSITPAAANTVKNSAAANSAAGAADSIGQWCNKLRFHQYNAGPVRQ